MNIGMNLLAILPQVSGGMEYYVHNLIRALGEIDNENQYYLITNIDNFHIFETRKANFHRIKIPIHARPQLLRVFFEQILLPLISRRLALAVLHSPSYTFPALCAAPGVVTICDMLYRIYPRAIGRGKLLFWKFLIPLSASKCKRVLTLSESSRCDIVKYLQVPTTKVIVTPLALDDQLACRTGVSRKEISEVRRRYGITKPYLLNVGGVGVHKNPKILLEALSLLRHQEKTKFLTLAITGHDYGYKRQIEEEVARLGLSESVVLTGYLPRKDLPPLYAGAEAYVSPSLLEGFGLTVLEAMHFGTPVVTANRHSLAQLAGDAAITVNPTNAEELSKAIYRILTDIEVKDELISRGFERVREFCWKNTANLTLAAYQAAARN